MDKQKFDAAFPPEPDEITKDGNLNPQVKWRIPEKQGPKKREANVAIGNVGRAVQAAAAPASGSGGTSSVAAPPPKRSRTSGGRGRGGR